MALEILYHRLFLDRSFRRSNKTTISITHLGGIFKYLFFDNSRQIVVSVLKACNNRSRCRLFNARRHSLRAVVFGRGFTSVGFGNADNSIVIVVIVSRFSARPVGYSAKKVTGGICILHACVVGVNNSVKITHRIIYVSDRLSEGIGTACYSVQGVIGSCDSAVLVAHGQNVLMYL